MCKLPRPISLIHLSTFSREENIREKFQSFRFSNLGMCESDHSNCDADTE